MARLVDESFFGVKDSTVLNPDSLSGIDQSRISVLGISIGRSRAIRAVRRAIDLTVPRDSFRREDYTPPCVDNFVILSLIGERGPPSPHAIAYRLFYARFQGRDLLDEGQAAFAEEFNEILFLLFCVNLARAFEMLMLLLSELNTQHTLLSFASRETIHINIYRKSQFPFILLPSIANYNIL